MHKVEHRMGAINATDIKQFLNRGWPEFPFWEIIIAFLKYVSAQYRKGLDIIGKFSHKSKYIYAFRFRTHLLTEIMEATRNYEWSPNGQQIAFISEDQTNSSLCIMRADGSELQHVADILPVDGRFAWSPDSQHLAYVGREEGGFWATLAIVNRDGTDRRHLARLNTGDESGEIHPSTPV